jgi:hypothetical protein
MWTSTPGSHSVPLARHLGRPSQPPQEQPVRHRCARRHLHAQVRGSVEIEDRPRGQLRLPGREMNHGVGHLRRRRHAVEWALRSADYPGLASRDAAAMAVSTKPVRPSSRQHRTTRAPSRATVRRRRVLPCSPRRLGTSARHGTPLATRRSRYALSRRVACGERRTTSRSPRRRG